MSNILQFNNQEFGELTVIEKDGEFFFIENRWQKSWLFEY